ncbi:hypothetical protein MTR_5g064117 [Medicago truncatula]|uniref:Uncharacterized protein n=1 Tax=Medicago truncatula TaxID=3880 RepID=A0A072UF49_MEDTR|nr:hypothetical protein MTR_5g064117 [Medicago truncatula]
MFFVGGGGCFRYCRHCNATAIVASSITFIRDVKDGNVTITITATTTYKPRSATKGGVPNVYDPTKTNEKKSFLKRS